MHHTAVIIPFFPTSKQLIPNLMKDLTWNLQNWDRDHTRQDHRGPDHRSGPDWRVGGLFLREIAV